MLFINFCCAKAGSWKEGRLLKIFPVTPWRHNWSKWNLFSTRSSFLMRHFIAPQSGMHSSVQFKLLWLSAVQECRKMEDYCNWCVTSLSLWQPNYPPLTSGNPTFIAHFLFFHFLTEYHWKYCNLTFIAFSVSSYIVKSSSETCEASLPGSLPKQGTTVR